MPPTAPAKWRDTYAAEAHLAELAGSGLPGSPGAAAGVLAVNTARRPPTHGEAVTVAVAASGLAGHEVSPGARDLLDRIGRGELSYDEAVAEVIAEFGQ